MIHRRSSVFAAVALAALVLPATAGAATTSPSPAAPPPRSKATFTVGMTEDIDSLNPFVGVQSNSYEMFGVMYDQLMDYGPKDGTPTPRLATSWSSSPDGLTWTYKIRQGVTWSDGVPLTASDAAYTFDRIIHGSAEQTNYGNYAALITKAAAPDPGTLVLTVRKPGPVMTHLIVPIIPEHIWKNIPEKAVPTFANDKAEVGSGPFVLDKRVPHQYVAFKANKNYWGGAPKIDELVFRVYDNADAEVQALKNGEIDFADSISNTLYESLKGAPGVKRIAADSGRFDEIAFNNGAATASGKPIGDGNPALKDPGVRRAISTAIDRKALVAKVLGGYGRPGTSVIPSTWAKFHYEPTDDAQNFDLAKAAQSLEQAGYRKGPDGIRRTPDGRKPLNLRLFARQENQQSQDTAQYVKGWLGQLGIKVTVSVISESKLTEVIGRGEFDMFEWSWGVEPDPDYQLSTFTCGQRSTGSNGHYSAGLSDSFYCNPAYDALYQRQKTELNPAARQDLVRQAEKLLYDDAGYAVTYYHYDLQAYRSDRFTGFVTMPQPGGAILMQPSAQWSYRTIAPAGATTAAKSGGGLGGIAVGVIVAVVVVLGGGLALFAVRRRRTADERE